MSQWAGERWEYLKVDIQAETDDDMIAAMNRLGSEGWNLAPAIRLQEPPPLIPGTRKVARTYAFTRRLPPAPVVGSLGFDTRAMRWYGAEEIRRIFAGNENSESSLSPTD